MSKLWSAGVHLTRVCVCLRACGTKEKRIILMNDSPKSVWSITQNTLKQQMFIIFVVSLVTRLKVHQLNVCQRLEKKIDLVVPQILLLRMGQGWTGQRTSQSLINCVTRQVWFSWKKEISEKRCSDWIQSQDQMWISFQTEEVCNERTNRPLRSWLIIILTSKRNQRKCHIMLTFSKDYDEDEDMATMRAAWAAYSTDLACSAVWSYLWEAWSQRAFPPMNYPEPRSDT